MDNMYVAKFPNGKWVSLDSRSGGFPIKVTELRDAHIWTDIGEAFRYTHLVREERLTIHLLTMTTSPPLTIPPKQRAEALGDKDYETYLRLAEKYGPTEACRFNEAWIGVCKASTVPGELFCKKHLGIECYRCGIQAVKNCGHTSQFVCGVFTCENHIHHSDG